MLSSISSPVMKKNGNNTGSTFSPKSISPWRALITNCPTSINDMPINRKQKIAIIFFDITYIYEKVFGNICVIWYNKV